jgi:putative intracellular protease/amidase
VNVANKILMVLTSNNQLGPNGPAAGSWLEELSGPYYVLVDAGCKVDIASVRGGSAPIDPTSAGDPWLTESGKRMLADAGVMRQLLTSPSVSQIDTSGYDAVFMVGGAAVMWDFPSDPGVGKVLSETLRAGGVVGGVCHGVGAFLNPAIVGDIAKRKMTCISDVEEKIVGLENLVPMMPESPLRKAGADLSFAAEPFGSNVVRDGKFITGQNPASAAKCGTVILEALKDRASRKTATA